MTISLWRYSHLALAVSSFIFITLAAVTGGILAVDAVRDQATSHQVRNNDKTTLDVVIPALTAKYTEITQLTVETNGSVILEGTDSTGKSVTAYVDPLTGEQVGTPVKKTAFIEWITSFHRSLFLHNAGRFVVGLIAFLLLLIATSGTALVIQRQKGVKRFFNKIVRGGFAQYYHVIFGRLSLLPIILISLSGTYLYLVKLQIITEKKIEHKINFDKVSGSKVKPADFGIFKSTPLSRVQSIEFPFSDDPEDYYTLKLKDRELVVGQVAGETLSEVKYPFTAIVESLSLDLHTGRKSIVWAVVLLIACAGILFFIYSGFVITFNRISKKIKNKYTAAESKIILLVGSESGSTMRAAIGVYKSLLAKGEKVFLAQLNDYAAYENAQHLVVLTATYGLGDPPSNAKNFIKRLEQNPQTHQVTFSVIGFGSRAYPDFCRFAFDVNNALANQSWAKPLLEIHTVNDRSTEQFNLWFHEWSQLMELPDLELPQIAHPVPPKLRAMEVMGKTTVANVEDAFLMQLQPKRNINFESGDLLVIYPARDHRERMYSIGKVGENIQLSIKLHQQGLGSGYLNALENGDQINARIIRNHSFYFPVKAHTVVMISNGTGIAPFLGMIDQNVKKKDCHLYCGFRDTTASGLYVESLHENMQQKKLNGLHIAYSREGEKQYVKDLLLRDKEFIVHTLQNGGVLMLCGSLNMQKDVIALLDTLCMEKMGENASYFQSRGQILMDCY